MALYKRGDVYWLDLYDVTGTRVRESTETTDPVKAREIHDDRKKGLRKQPANQAPTWDVATDRWLKERTDKSSLSNDKSRIEWLDTYWAGKLMSAIDDKEVKRVLDIKKNGVSKRGKISITTVNHYLKLIRALFNYARSEWNWEVAPITLKKYKGGDKKRVRWLKPEEMERLLGELPAHMKPMVEFAVFTGLRQQNVTHLRWDQVDMKRRKLWVESEEYKNDEDHGIALSDEAMKVLEVQTGLHPIFVFPYQGRAITSPKTAWSKALKRAGITNFRWHDLRHCFASNHALNGTPLLTLKTLGGWKSLQMVDRYAFLAVEGQRNYVNNSTFRE